MPHQHNLLPDDPEQQLMAFDEQQQEEARRPLTPADLDRVRHIEGFPVASDEAIIALSDPPYYTACPNPFLPDIVARWQQEREHNDDEPYHREPFAFDVSEGKNDPIYNAHSYHTKVPHKAIMRYILHYTEPGDIVFDGFCGTGMTGVAAQLCGNRGAVESLGYRVDEEGIVYEGDRAISRLGTRKAVLCDLSPAATFIAYNYNTPVNVVDFEREAKRILAELEQECGWMYETRHTDGSVGWINYTVWSDVFICPDCGGDIVFWEAAVDKEAGKVRDTFACPHCGAEQTKRRLDRAWRTCYDSAINQTIRQAKQVPVLINYTAGKKRHEKEPDADDLALIERIEDSEIHYWFPKDRMPEGEESRRNDDIGLTHVHHFYTRRNLCVLAALRHRIISSDFFNGSRSLLFPFTAMQRSVSRLASIAFSYYFHGGGGAINAGAKGTLYVSSTVPEVSIFHSFRSRLKSMLFDFRSQRQNFVIETASSNNLHMSDESIDYIFVDPPFGGNLMYSEL